MAASLGGLHDKVTDGRVRRGHVIEAMDLAHRPFERAAHDEPHHEFDAFRSRLAQVLVTRYARQRFRILDHVVEESAVELLVDESRPRTLELVTHAAGTPDLHVEILV